jgi:hypothetical protein
MLALVLLALVAVLLLSRNSLAPWTFWLSGLVWVILLPIVASLALWLLLDLAAAGF